MKKIFTFLVLCAFLTQNFVFFSEVNANDDVAPVFEKITVSSNNTNQRYAKAGDEVTITLNINPGDTWKEGNNVTSKIGETEIGTIRNFSKSDNSKTSGNITYIIKDGQNGKFSFKDLVFQDASGNNITGFTSDYIPQDDENVIVDTNAPVIEFTDDVNPDFSSSDSVNITVTDTNFKEAKYGFSDDATCNETDTYDQVFTSGVAFNLTTKANNGKYICVKAEDQAGNISYKNSASAIKINNVPTDILLTSNSVDENSPIGTVIGTLSTTDADTSDTHTYEFTVGGADNSSFEIEGNNLKTNSNLDYETKNSYSIKIKSTDISGQFFEKNFTINVTDVDDTAPVFDKIEVTSTKAEKNGKKYLKQGDSFDVVLNLNPEDTWGDNNVKLFIGDKEIKTLSFEKHDTDNKKSKTLNYTIEANQNGEISFRDLVFKDASGNDISGFNSPYAIQNIIVDTVVEKPVIGDLPEYINSTTQNLSITGSCETGSTVNFEFTNLKLGMTISTTPVNCENSAFSLSLLKTELDKFEEGNITIKVKQTDLAGNESEFSELKTVKKDTIKPVLNISGVTINNQVNTKITLGNETQKTLKLGNQVLVLNNNVIKTDENGFGIKDDTYNITLEKSEIQNEDLEPIENGYKIKKIGTYTFKFNVKDNAGNTAEEKSFTITVEENDKKELNKQIEETKNRLSSSSLVSDENKKNLEDYLKNIAIGVKNDKHSTKIKIDEVIAELKKLISKLQYSYAPNKDSLIIKNDKRVFSGNEEKPLEDTKKDDKKEEKNENKKLEEFKEKLKKENKELKYKKVNGKDRPYILSKKYSSCGLISNIVGDYNLDYKISFTDTNSKNNLDEIQRLTKVGVLNEKGVNNSGLFEPNRGLTRAEFLAIVLKSHCYDITKSPEKLPYSDVNLDSWQAKVVKVANEIGLVKGYSDGTFKPNRQISKIEAFGIMMKMADISILENYKDSYTDKKAEWQGKVLSTGEYLGVLNPKNTNNKFNPDLALTRDEMVKLIVDIVRLY